MKRTNSHYAFERIDSSQNGTAVVSCGNPDGQVQNLNVWNIDLELQQSLEAHGDKGVFDVAMSPDSTTIVSGDNGEEMKI